MQTRHLEDFHPGETIELGSRSVDRDEIIEFARKYDPQPFHVDEEAGRRSIYGGLIASGWDTVGVVLRVLGDAGAFPTAPPGSPGIRAIRLPLAPRPGGTPGAPGIVLGVVPSPFPS